MTRIKQIRTDNLSVFIRNICVIRVPVCPIELRQYKSATQEKIISIAIAGNIKLFFTDNYDVRFWWHLHSIT
jgi:hypothetical protein